MAKGAACEIRTALMKEIKVDPG